ncbi:MAG TPA: metallopeptidase family protein [Ktedonobacteraceae bacterium]|jgi:predicted Zn-dependent protease with MMP-like domain
MDQQDQQQEEAYDYNREPPLDRDTLRANRRRSKYVFMTLCFLLALALFYTFLTKPFISDSSSWFPLFGAIALAIMGVVFLRSSDNLPLPPTAVSPTAADDPTGALPPQQALSPFEILVQEALAGIPAALQAQMENIAVRVVYEPDTETLTRVGIEPGYTLLGLYEGVPLTVYGRDSMPYPELITIFQRPIEEYCQHDPERIRARVRATVLHEVAHHFGLGHAEMPIWLKE